RPTGDTLVPCTTRFRSLLWQQDRKGFLRRVDQFLDIAAKHGIRPMLVLFDSCWDPDPVLGPQRRPIPGVHNSGWLQSPGRHALRSEEHTSELQSRENLV